MKRATELLHYVPLVFIALCSLLALLSVEFGWGVYPSVQGFIFTLSCIEVVHLHGVRADLRTCKRLLNRIPDQEEEEP